MFINWLSNYVLFYLTPQFWIGGVAIYKIWGPCPLELQPLQHAWIIEFRWNHRSHSRQSIYFTWINIALRKQHEDLQCVSHRRSHKAIYVFSMNQWRFGETKNLTCHVCVRTCKGAVTCAVCPESAWLVTFLICNVSTWVVTWSALRCGASGEPGKKVAAAQLSKTAAAAAAAKTWFAKHPLDDMLHNRFPWKRSCRRSSMWPPCSLRRNMSAAACRPCDRSLR